MFYLILFTHWFADFICQTRGMANNKSKSNSWLLYHISTYTAIMSIFGIKYALINGACHFATDYVTSRCTSHLWKKQDIHGFFAVIGFDQFLHVAVLYGSMNYANGIVSWLF